MKKKKRILFIVSIKYHIMICFVK